MRQRTYPRKKSPARMERKRITNLTPFGREGFSYSSSLLVALGLTEGPSLLGVDVPGWGSALKSMSVVVDD